VYRVKHNPVDDKEKIPFILDLACGDEGVYDDIMQSVAPIIYRDIIISDRQKPTLCRSFLLPGLFPSPTSTFFLQDLSKAIEV